MNRQITPGQALRLMQRWCAAQDRSQEEARRKLLRAGIRGANLEDVLAELISSGFIDEERFARAFVRGKMRMKGWGRQKIQAALRQHQVPDRLIRIALEAELDQADYLAALDKAASRKWSQLQGVEEHERKIRLIRFLMGKGFTHEEAILTLDRLREQSS